MGENKSESSIAAIAPELANEIVAVLHEARESLIHHAINLPLSRRDHGPVLVRIDHAIDLIVEALS